MACEVGQSVGGHLVAHPGHLLHILRRSSSQNPFVCNASSFQAQYSNNDNSMILTKYNPLERTEKLEIISCFLRFKLCVVEWE